MQASKQLRTTKARRIRGARAFSLLELVAVLAVVSLLATAGFATLGSRTFENLSAEGFARKLALDLSQARRRTIASGDNHYLQLTIAGGSVASYTMYRRADSGDVAVDQTCLTPAGVTAAASHTTLEFDFDGASLAAYSLAINGPSRSWTVSTTALTGAVHVQ